jgi:tRNA-specific 2-thiouridylase
VAVHLCEDDQGLAAGQFTAFYQGRTCIGSGVILESWDDKGFPVCEKALELARLEDKSNLGKPVKIKVKPETSDQESVQKDGIEPDKGLAEPRVAVTG